MAIQIAMSKFNLTKFFSKKYFFRIVTILFIFLIVSLGLLLILFFITPTRFAFPKSDHLHFRLQYVYRGQAENFGNPRYQVDYLKDVCNNELTESPIHFHDNKDQIVHIHWQNITGGDVLKFYGVNKVGGIDTIMGYKFDQLWQLKITQVPIHSQSLPKPFGDDQFFVYTGDKDNFSKRDFDDFLNLSLEQFFNKNSSVRIQQEEYQKFKEERQQNRTGFNFLSPIIALAHNGVNHQSIIEAEQHLLDEKKAQANREEIEKRNNLMLTQNQDQQLENNNLTEAELQQINNLIGNVVIFVQPTEPTQEQVQARFNQLEPLGLSSCGG